MRQRDVQRLDHGLYRIVWRNGGSSLASVGSTYNGSRWMATANWTHSDNKFPLVASTNWRDVKAVQLLVKDGGENERNQFTPVGELYREIR